MHKIEIVMCAFVFSVVICLFLIIFIILMILINIMQNKERHKIADELIKLKNGDQINPYNPILHNIYKELEKKFQDNLEDYKRLNSYLYHEQKNLISILRTTMELNGQNENISILDNITTNIDDVLTLNENKEISSVALVDVSLICAKVIDSYKLIHSNISYEFPEYEDTEIIAKERWIYRAVTNLIDNAIKYGNGSKISVNIISKNNSIIVSVKDNGIGISIEKQQKIFDNLYRINELNSNGYGIGLSLVSHVCNLCGGYVFVDSQLGIGSTFILSFPKANI